MFTCRILQRSIFAAMVMFFWACTDPTHPVGIKETGIEARASRTAEPLGRLRTIDDDFENLVATVPGFGGLFYDQSGTLNVYLKDATSRSAVASGLVKFLARGDASLAAKKKQEVASMKVLVGKYDYAQLATWYRKIVPLLNDPGVTFTDIDEAQNRVVIGVLDGKSRVAVTRSIEQSGVPSGLVRLELIAPVQAIRRGGDPRSSSSSPSPYCIGCGGSDNLQGQVRPVPASVKIESQVEDCSIGWNAYFRDNSGVYDGARYFITASHCSLQKWALDGTVFGQPTYGSPIADEVADPTPFTNATNSACPLGYRCRYSDALLARYRPGITWRHGVIPSINNVSPFQIVSYTTITGTDPQWGTAPPSIYVGLALRKTGEATGMSPGTLVHTCVGIHRYEHTVSTDEWLLCQFQASSLYNDYGDSGSAVYHPNPAGWADPIMGLLWGYQYDNNVYGTPVLSTFSHAWYVTVELANAWGGGWLDAGLGACGQCGY